MGQQKEERGRDQAHIDVQRNKESVVLTITTRLYDTHASMLKQLWIYARLRLVCGYQLRRAEL